MKALLTFFYMGQSESQGCKKNETVKLSPKELIFFFFFFFFLNLSLAGTQKWL